MEGAVLVPDDEGGKLVRGGDQQARVLDVCGQVEDQFRCAGFAGPQGRPQASQIALSSLQGFLPGDEIVVHLPLIIDDSYPAGIGS